MNQTAQKITGRLGINEERQKEIRKKINTIPDFKKAIEKGLNRDITEIMELILGGAVNLDASDLHIEPEEKEAKIRLRIDGMLQDVVYIETKTYRGLLSRIKLISGLKLNITKKAQDGRFTVFIPPNPVEIRSSILPAEYGESIVLRLLNPKNLMEIETLGLRESLLEQVLKEIKKPNGMIVVTGPTGSGKTTTLYAFLKKIQKPEIKIITIEDPIEYHLKGISQTQADPAKGYDFANGLKSIMRQDPDVVLVGEIRDLETSKIALQAALTGHLVLTTLHTNDATGTIARLQALGEKTENIAPALNMAIAQRLVRRVCEQCSSLETVSGQTLKKIKDSLQGVAEVKEILSLSQTLKIPAAKGCTRCNFTGYRGRIGIFESFLVNFEVENFILKSPSISELREMMIKKGMVSIYQDGLLKVLRGITTLEEIERVVTEE